MELSIDQKLDKTELDNLERELLRSGTIRSVSVKFRDGIKVITFNTSNMPYEFHLDTNNNVATVVKYPEYRNDPKFVESNTIGFHATDSKKSRHYYDRRQY